MRVLFVLIFLTALILPPVALAEIQTFAATHTYIMGDDDSRNTARQKCLAEAKRKVLEQVGVYLESKSELITSSLSTASGSAKSPQTTNEERQQITEQIDTLAAGVMRTEVVKEEFGEVNGRLQITLTLKSEVDPDDIRKQLAERRVDQKVRKQVTEQQHRLAQLEQQLYSMMEEMRSKTQDKARSEQKQNIGLPPATEVEAIRMSAKGGDAQAQNLLGQMYVLGQSVPQDYVQAIAWFRQSAKQNHAGAQTNLGWMYRNGKGVAQSDTEALVLYRRAAEQGDANGQHNLGMMYQYGNGVAKDYTVASEWYQKAAKQGHGEAAQRLRMMTMAGLVRHDNTETLAWYRKLAEQGNAQAQINLGVMYAKGSGVPQDYVQAYKWLRLASANGDKDADEKLEKLTSQMTPAQIAEAQRLSQQCQTRQFKGC